MLNKKKSVYDNNKDGKDWKVLFESPWKGDNEREPAIDSGYEDGDILKCGYIGDADNASIK